MKSWSVILTWKNRPELRETLRANAPLLNAHAAEVIVVNCGGDPDQLDSLVADAGVDDLRQIVLPGASFSRSMAINLGAFCGSGQFILVLDADVVMSSDLMAQSEPLLRQSACFVKTRKVRETKPPDGDWPFGAHFTQQVMAMELTAVDGRTARLQLFSFSDGSRCGSGLMMMRRGDFIAVGGCNSTLTGWGFDDLDLHIRLQLQLGLEPHAIGEVLHLSHGDDVRDLQGGERPRSYIENRRICFENCAAGRMAGTYEADITSWKDRLHVFRSPQAARARH